MRLTLTRVDTALRPSADLIGSARGALRMHCGSVRSVHSVACRQKGEKRSTFQVATDPSD